MRVLLVISIMSLGYTVFASECLNLAEQKQLGAILVKQDEAIQKSPGCVNMQGAAACLMPYDQTVKTYFENKLKECSKEQ